MGSQTRYVENLLSLIIWTSSYYFSGIDKPIWTGVIGLNDFLEAQKSSGKKRNRREALSPYQCLMRKDEGFLCFHPGKAITICETNPIEVVETTTLPPVVYNYMVVAGSNPADLDHVEVINSETLMSCSNLPATYPVAGSNPTAMRHDSKIVICDAGGDCYSYSDDVWTLAAFSLEPARDSAMSVEIRPGEWLIMGGYDSTTNDPLDDTKLFKNGAFTDGPTLPEPIASGSAVMLDENRLFVAGGDFGFGASVKNYLLDINTNEWTPIADRTLSPSTLHSSGIFMNSTAEEIQVANIGRNEIEVYSPSENSWHQIDVSIPLPSGGIFGRLDSSAAIQQGTDSFILIGGSTNVDTYNGDIYLFDENGISIIQENALQVGRRLHVAIPISEDDFTCE